LDSSAEVIERAYVPRITVLSLVGLTGLLVLVVYLFSARVAVYLGAYGTGLATLTTFVLLGFYGARKHSLWISARIFRLLSFLPTPLHRRLVSFDSLKTWRDVHIVLGVFSILPFAWHMRIGLMSPLETVLLIAVCLLITSGIFGTWIQEKLPPSMTRRGNQEVRLRDVEARYNALYVEAEEMILGHSEALVDAYLKSIKPLMIAMQPRRSFFFATLAGADPAPALCESVAGPGIRLGDDAQTYSQLLDILLRKLRLEHNEFNILLSTEWLKAHLALAAVTGVLVTFHVAGALYFYGI